MRLENGKQSVEVFTNEESWNAGVWSFCQNGFQSSGVSVSVKQFDMLKELVMSPEVVEFYEKERQKRPCSD